MDTDKLIDYASNSEKTDCSDVAVQNSDGEISLKDIENKYVQ